jgi:hypothetical protein
MSQIRRRVIGIAPQQALASQRDLFDLWRAIYPVEFEFYDPGASNRFDGLIFFESCDASVRLAEASGLNSLLVDGRGANLVSVQRGTVEFRRTAFVDQCFSGQTMHEELIGRTPELILGPNDDIVCLLDSRPYWVTRQCERARISIVALPPPEVKKGQHVYQHFNRRGWLQMLPYFQFLKHLTHGDWETPPLRACLMFDDPNLHWWTYGFINFEDLISHAQEFNYHVSLATVPIDNWYVHKGVAGLCRKESARISLCMHGNDHAPRELNGAGEPTQLLRSLAQGLRRIVALEARSGLEVARVMVPPHGAFRRTVASQLLALGYEGACVSRASLVAWNDGMSWPATFGHSMVEYIDGMPIIPRQVLAPGHEDTYRLAAFLNQPIIPHAHHEDCSSGLDFLKTAAGVINGLGNVRWTSMAGISRSNFEVRRINDTMLVKMHSRRIDLPVDKMCQQIIVLRPWLSGDADEELLVVESAGLTVVKQRFGQESGALLVRGAETLAISSPPPSPVNYQSLEAPSFRLWGLPRRLLSEGRDRLRALRLS